MARRRSLNRRGSRKSFNITDLDQNSELVDSRDPLWWKNIEGDMTVGQSRLSIHGDMTGSILNNDSAVSTAELNKEWWKSLDNTATNALRRSSPRKSTRSTKTPSDSFISEASDESSIKKRKVAIQARDKKDVGTDNFLAVLNDPDAPLGRKEKSRGRSKDGEASPRRSNRQSQGKNVGDSEADTTVNTSNDTDIVLKSRPKPFKKRFTKGSNDIFYEAESPRGPNSSENQRIDESVDNSLSVEKSLSESRNVRDSQLMGPPKMASHKKRLSSISRRIDMSSEDSESDGGKRKPRLGFRKKSRKGVSMNPFDKLIGADLEAREIASSQGEVDTAKEGSTLVDSRRENSGDEISADQNPPGTLEINNKIQSRSTIPESHKDPVGKSSDRENSQSQQIEDTSDDDGENRENFSTRGSPEMSLDREHRKSSQDLENAVGRSSRSVRTSKRLDNKSTYDLLPQDRSTTPVISDSDGEEKEELPDRATAKKSLQISLRSNRSGIENVPPPKEAPEVLSQSQTNRTRKLRGNNSRTRIFSDEDISIEGSLDGERNGNLTHKGDVGKSRKSLAVNKSRGISQASSVSDGRMEAEDRGASISESMNLEPQEHVRRSSESRPRSITAIIPVDRVQPSEKFDASPAGLEAAIVDQSISGTLRGFRKSSINRSVTSNLQSKVPELEEIDEDGHEPENDSNFQSSLKTRRSRKSIANKSRRKTLKQKLAEPDESEDEREISRDLEKLRVEDNDQSISPNFRSRENPRASEDQNEASLEPEVSDDDEESSRQVKKSRSYKKPKNSQASVETTDEEESQDVPNDSKPSNSHPKGNLRSSSKSLTPFERSRHNSRPPEDISDDELEAAEKMDAAPLSFRLKEKSRNSRKSLAKRKQNFSDADESSAEENANENHQKSTAEKKSVKAVRSILKNASKTIESNVNTSEAETEKNYEVWQNSPLAKKSRESAKSFETNESPRVLFDEDEGEEEAVQGHGVTSINRSQENARSGKIVGEDGAENVRKSHSHSRKSRRTRKSFPQMEQIPENDAETSHKLVTTSNSKSPARRGVSQEGFDVDDITNERNEENEDLRGPSMSKKSINPPGPSRDVSTNPATKSSRETLSSNKPNSKSFSDLNSSNFRPLAASLASTQHSTPLRVQKNITDFFPSKFLQKSNNPPREVKTTFDKKKLKMLKEKLKDEMKNREAHSMQQEAEVKKKGIVLKNRLADSAKQKRLVTGEPATSKKSKVIDKAFIVNGVVYKQPRLPRPKPWVTDRLYRYLWKLMEPKYRLSTRIKSEQFIQDLAKAVVLIMRRTKYESYKHELNGLMKNMATLGIIRTRNDFYDFCYDFLPYDFRVKVTPIMMPGNVLTIPYDPAKLHMPLLREP